MPIFSKQVRRSTSGPYVKKQGESHDEEVIFIQDASGFDVCEMHGDYPEMEATADLLLASPDTADALEACMRKLVELTPRDRVTSTQVAKVLEQALAALKKAGRR